MTRAAWFKNLGDGVLEVLAPNAMVEAAGWHWKTTSAARRDIDTGKIELSVDWHLSFLDKGEYKFVACPTEFIAFYRELPGGGVVWGRLNICDLEEDKNMGQSKQTDLIPS